MVYCPEFAVKKKSSSFWRNDTVLNWFVSCKKNQLGNDEWFGVDISLPQLRLQWSLQKDHHNTKLGAVVFWLSNTPYKSLKTEHLQPGTERRAFKMVDTHVQVGAIGQNFSGE